MASSRLFNAIGRLGVGLAIAGGVVNSMLYNGLTKNVKSQWNEKKTLFLVDGGHRAVIFDRFQGVKPDVIGEGTHFMIPWLQRPILFDIRTRPRSVPSSTGTKGSKKRTNEFLSFRFKLFPFQIYKRSTSLYVFSIDLVLKFYLKFSPIWVLITKNVFYRQLQTKFWNPLWYKDNKFFISRGNFRSFFRLNSMQVNWLHNVH